MWGFSALTAAFTGLIALQGDERLGLNRMGTKSEQFCRQTLNILGQNPQVVPSTIKVADAQADLDQIRRRIDSAALLFKVRVLTNELRQQQLEPGASSASATNPIS